MIDFGTEPIKLGEMIYQEEDQMKYVGAVSFNDKTLENEKENLKRIGFRRDPDDRGRLPRKGVYQSDIIKNGKARLIKLIIGREEDPEKDDCREFIGNAYCAIYPGERDARIMIGQNYLRSSWKTFQSVLKHEEGHFRDMIRGMADDEAKYVRKVAKKYEKERKAAGDNRVIHDEGYQELVADMLSAIYTDGGVDQTLRHLRIMWDFQQGPLKSMRNEFVQFLKETNMALVKMKNDGKSDEEIEKEYNRRYTEFFKNNEDKQHTIVMVITRYERILENSKAAFEKELKALENIKNNPAAERRTQYLKMSIKSIEAEIENYKFNIDAIKVHGNPKAFTVAYAKMVAQFDQSVQKGTGAKDAIIRLEWIQKWGPVFKKAHETGDYSEIQKYLGEYKSKIEKPAPPSIRQPNPQRSNSSPQRNSPQSSGSSRYTPLIFRLIAGIFKLIGWVLTAPFRLLFGNMAQEGYEYVLNASDDEVYFYLEQAKEEEENEDREKYDDKYDLDNDQGATIEPADVDVDDDFDYGSSDEDDDEEDDDDKKDDKKKPKKKSSKKKDKDDEDKDDEEIDVEEEGFKEGIKETGHQIVKGLKRGFQDIGSGIKDRFDDAADDLDKIKNAGSFGGAVKETLNTLPRAYKHDYDMEDKWARDAAQSRMDVRNAILDAFESKNKVDKAARTAKRKAGEAIRDAGTKVGDKISESYRYQEAAALIKKTAKQDIDEAMESRLGENNYYTFIANSSKDLEHLYKTLMKRASKEAILEEMTNIFNELKERRESYYSSKHDDAHDPKRSYQGLKRVIDQDIENIEKNIEILSDPKNEKPNKSLMKKTIKMINNLQQDMITECERSQPMVIRHVRDIAKKLWLFEYDIDEADGNVTMESGEDAMFAKVGEMLVHYRKQKELQDLAEKNGVEINGMRLTDDTIMNIVTSCVALMLAKEEGDPRYHQLVDQGMRKRSLKVDIINSYKSRANDLINRYDHGPIVGAEPYRRDIEVISDEDEPEYEEEFYLDENGEMQSSYYQESDDEESTNDPFHKLEQEIGKKLPSIYRKIIPTEQDPTDHLREMSERFVDKKIKTGNDAYSEYTFNELYSVEQVLKNLNDHDGYLSFDEGDGFGNYVLIKISDWKIYLYIHDESDKNKYVKIANSLEDLCSKLHVSTDKLIDEYYQESDEDDSDTNLDEDDEANDPEKDTDNKSKDEDNSEDDDKDKDTDDDEEDIDDEDNDNDNDDEDDSEDDDDDEDDELEEEFYIDPDTGELKSSWYAEMDESYDGAGAVSNSKRKDPDELIEWEVKPGNEVEDIEFGATRTKTQKKLEKDFGQPKKSTVEMDDYGKFIVYYESDKVARVTIIKDIQIELDRSIVFPGKIDNLRKKALDIKPEGDDKLVSKIMSIEVVLNSDDTINSITFARRQYYSDKSFQKFDKVSWHTDQGMDEKNVIKRFKEVYKFLDKHSLLTPAGKDEMKHIGSDSVLTTNEVTERGAQFLRIYYDKCMQYDYHTIRDQLEQCWRQFTSQSYSKGE